MCIRDVCHAAAPGRRPWHVTRLASYASQEKVIRRVVGMHAVSNLAAEQADELMWYTIASLKLKARVRTRVTTCDGASAFRLVQKSNTWDDSDAAPPVAAAPPQPPAPPAPAVVPAAAPAVVPAAAPAVAPAAAPGVVPAAAPSVAPAAAPGVAPAPPPLAAGAPPYPASPLLIPPRPSLSRLAPPYPAPPHPAPPYPAPPYPASPLLIPPRPPQVVAPFGAARRTSSYHRLFRTMSRTTTTQSSTCSRTNRTR